MNIGSNPGVLDIFILLFPAGIAGQSDVTLPPAELQLHVYLMSNEASMFYLADILLSWFLGTQSTITLTDMGIFPWPSSLAWYHANKWLGTSWGHSGFLPGISV